MSELSYDRLVAELVAQATDFADLVADAGDDLRVPTCPKWTLGDLVRHLGLAYHRALLFVTGRERLAVPFEHVPAGSDPLSRHGENHIDGPEDRPRTGHSPGAGPNGRGSVVRWVG